MGLRERASGGARPDYTIEVCGEEDFLWAGAGLMNDFRVCHCVTVTSRLHISPFVTRVCLWGGRSRRGQQSASSIAVEPCVRPLARSRPASAGVHRARRP